MPNLTPCKVCNTDANIVPSGGFDGTHLVWLCCKPDERARWSVRQESVSALGFGVGQTVL